MVRLIINDDVWCVVCWNLTGGRYSNDFDRFFCGVGQFRLTQQPLAVAQEPADNLTANWHFKSFADALIDEDEARSDGLPRTSRHDHEDTFMSLDQSSGALVTNNDLEVASFFVAEHLFDLVFIHHNRHLCNSSLLIRLIIHTKENQSTNFKIFHDLSAGGTRRHYTDWAGIVPPSKLC
ncbi:hypothetical protein D3C73_1028660 [compost metagenome]